MNRLHSVLLSLSAIMLWCPSISVSAAGPLWKKLVPFNRVDADPGKSYYLTEKQGPWMVFAASFAGDGSHADAHDLVMELRSRFHLPAYTHKEHFDFRDPLTGRGLNQDLKPKRMKHNRSIEFDEVAVLIGDFHSVNDASLQEVLKLVKYTHPKCLQLDAGKDTTLRFAGLRSLQRRLKGDERKKKKGPMGNAFVTRNPLLPQEYFVPRGVDKFVMSMNKGVEHSLLDCPAKFSVRVATFRGNVITDQRKIQKVNQGAKMKSHLHAAAHKAHKLVVALRQQKIEAYEFHDRHESIVTVGSFDSIGGPRPDGKTEINSAVLRIMKAYGPQRKQLPGGGRQKLAGFQPRTLAGVAFDVQPVPVEVPRRSIAVDYARFESSYR